MYKLLINGKEYEWSNLEITDNDLYDLFYGVGVRIKTPTYLEFLTAEGSYSSARGGCINLGATFRFRLYELNETPYEYDTKKPQEGNETSPKYEGMKAYHKLSQDKVWAMVYDGSDQALFEISKNHETYFRPDENGSLLVALKGQPPFCVEVGDYFYSNKEGKLIPMKAQTFLMKYGRKEEYLFTVKNKSAEKYESIDTVLVKATTEESAFEIARNMSDLKNADLWINKIGIYQGKADAPNIVLISYTGY